MTVMSNPSSLEPKVCLVTGGARRIGAEISRALHRAGARVAIHYRSSHDEARALAAELNEIRKKSALSLQADLQGPDVSASIIRAVVVHFGQLDVLVNNASSFYQTPLGSITHEQWDDLVGSNMKAPLFLSQAAAVALRKTSGNIINVVDIHARRPLRDYVVYSVAKAGLAMITRGLARELAPEIRVNGVAPGAILWPESGLDETTREKIIEQTALKRTGCPEDIVNCILFLLTDADYVTGQIIAVDGGRSIGW